MLFYEALPDRGDRRSLTSVKKSASVSQARLRVSSGGAPGSTAGGLTLGSPGGPMIMSPPQRKISTPTGGVANLLLPSPTRTTPEGIVCIVAEMIKVGVLGVTMYGISIGGPTRPTLWGIFKDESF